MKTKIQINSEFFLSIEALNQYLPVIFHVNSQSFLNLTNYVTFELLVTDKIELEVLITVFQKADILHEREMKIFSSQYSQVFFFVFLVPTLLRYCSLCWDYLEVVQTRHTCQALPCGSRAGADTWTGFKPTEVESCLL